MLERIQIENYKCLRDVTVDLAPFTILIGPNDSGKSSFLEVVRSLSRIINEGYPAVFTDERTLANLVWRKEADRDVVFAITASAAGHRSTYRLELPVDAGSPPREELEWDGTKVLWTEPISPNPHNPRGGLSAFFMSTKGPQPFPVQYGGLGLSKFKEEDSPAFAPIGESLASCLEYQFKLDQLPIPSVPQPEIKLESSGSNLAAVLDVMQNSPDRAPFEALQTALNAAIPTLKGIVLPPVPQQHGAKALEFILSGNGKRPVTIPGSLASGGALLLTAYLAAAYTQTPGLLLFEEPENGLHPSRLQMVIDILRKMSRGEVGNRKRQIIITTHNPLVLNYAKPEEVRVFVRDLEKGTHVVPMKDVPDIDRLLKEFALGELWYLLGEEKLFQGQPA
jgi:predicted ATPase